VGEVFSPPENYSIKADPESASPLKVAGETRGKSSFERAGPGYTPDRVKVFSLRLILLRVNIVKTTLKGAYYGKT
jgi:hypothetical protein